MLKSLLLSAMLTLLPPSAHTRAYLREPEEDAQKRYEAIAEDVEAVAMDPAEQPLFTGPGDRAATALFLTLVAWHESGFRKDVDSCSGPRGKGDHGRSVSLLQINRGPNYEGHSPGEICTDRRLAIRLGLHVLQRAKETCGKGGPRSWLQSYAGGTCTTQASLPRQVCSAFERIGRKSMSGIGCSSLGPVSLMDSTGT